MARRAQARRVLPAPGTSHVRQTHRRLARLATGAVPVGQTVVIVRRPQERCSRDFVTVYEAHYPRLVRALEIGGLDRPTAEDVAQEAFARTLGHWRRVRLGTNPPGTSTERRSRLSRSHWKHEYPLETEQASRHDTAAEGRVQSCPLKPR